LGKFGIPTLPLPQLITAANQALDQMSKAVAGGNQAVFAEVGREFSTFIDTFKGDTAYNQAKVDAYLAHFTPDQAQLRQGFAAYAKAMFEQDPKKKAELMLLGNDAIGADEQARLSPWISKALNSPEGVFREVLHDAVNTAINSAPWYLKYPAKLAEKTGVF